MVAVSIQIFALDHRRIVDESADLLLHRSYGAPLVDSNRGELRIEPQKSVCRYRNTVVLWVVLGSAFVAPYGRSERRMVQDVQLFAVGRG